MEAKLKALKVVELKDILTHAGVAIPARANKPDLIAKILASPEALGHVNGDEVTSKPVSMKAANGGAVDASSPNAKPLSSSRVEASAVDSSAAPTSDVLPPPEEFDWSADGAVTTSTTAIKPPSSKSATTTTTTTTVVVPGGESKITSTNEKPTAAEDEELAKRKARAARFNVPFVEPKQTPKQLPKTQATPAVLAAPGKATPVKTSAVVDDPQKLQARANRFNVMSSSTTKNLVLDNTAAGRKRAAEAVEEVDAEELERRRKRAERFGLAMKA